MREKYLFIIFATVNAFSLTGNWLTYKNPAGLLPFIPYLYESGFGLYDGQWALISLGYLLLLSIVALALPRAIIKKKETKTIFIILHLAHLFLCIFLIVNHEKYTSFSLSYVYDGPIIFVLTIVGMIWWWIKIPYLEQELSPNLENILDD